MTTTRIDEETKLITGEELLAMGDIGHCELIDGRIVPMTPPGVEHGYFESEIAGYLRSFNRQNPKGWVLSGEVGVYIRRNPDRVRGMDVAFISYQKLPERPIGYLAVAPELVVEIISPNDRWRDIRDKLEEYFAIGVERVWIVDPARGTVLIFRTSTDFVKLTTADTLYGEGPLTGFSLPLTELFAG